MLQEPELCEMKKMFFSEFYLEKAAREERVLQRPEFQVELLGARVDVVRPEGQWREALGVTEHWVHWFHRVRDDCAVTGGDQRLEGVGQGPDQIRGERVPEHVGHQNLGGRGYTYK